MYNWDYKLKEGWKPATEGEWLWYLERKINHDDWDGLKKVWIKEHFPKLKGRLDPGKRIMLENYLKNE